MELHAGAPLELLRPVALYYSSLGLVSHEVRWPPVDAALDQGVVQRVLKNPRSAALGRLQTAVLDIPLTRVSMENYAATNEAVVGYWSSRSLCFDLGKDLEERRPVLSHWAVASGDEHFVDRELKRITVFEDFAETEAAGLYLIECLLKALSWKAAELDKSRESARFVSIPLADLLTFPSRCVTIIESLVCDFRVGVQHVDVVARDTKHNLTGRCACTKLIAEDGAKSYLVFAASKVKSFLNDLIVTRTLTGRPSLTSAPTTRDEARMLRWIPAALAEGPDTSTRDALQKIRTRCSPTRRKKRRLE